MKIITDLKIYNFHLIISYLGAGLDIIPIIDLRQKHLSDFNYKNKIIEGFDLNELTAKNHILYGVHENRISRFELLKNEKFHINKELNLSEDISQITIDPNIDNLYAMSDQSGIIELNIRNPNIPKKVKELIPKAFETIGDPVLSNLISKNNIIALSIRGYGINKIDNSTEKGSLQFDLRSSDPQDVNFLSNTKFIIIADAFDGIIIFNEIQKKIEKKVSLPEGDFPQQIELINGNVLIKGKHKLYLLHLNNYQLEILWENKIGSIAKYYEYVIFSSKGKLVLFRLSSKEKFEKSYDIEKLSEISKIELK